MHIHPELGLRMAQIKIEDARARAERAAALRAASAGRRGSGATASTRQARWAERALAAVRSPQARPSSLRAKAPRTTKG